MYQGWVEREEHGGLVVVVEDLAMDWEVDGIGAGRGSSRPPADKVKGRSFVYIFDFEGVSAQMHVDG